MQVPARDTLTDEEQRAYAERWSAFVREECDASLSQAIKDCPNLTPEGREFWGAVLRNYAASLVARGPWSER